MRQHLKTLKCPYCKKTVCITSDMEGNDRGYGTICPHFDEEGEFFIIHNEVYFGELNES